MPMKSQPRPMVKSKQGKMLVDALGAEVDFLLAESLTTRLF